MRANELHNLSVSPLVTSSFALEWSEDNHISLITSRGVHVFEFVPHPMSLSPALRFWRTFIYPSEFAPAEAFKSQVNATLWQMNRDDMYELLLDQAMTPKIEQRTDLSARIAKLAWSPANLAKPSKCLLAIVTNAGSAEILHKLGDNWFAVWNLSKQWSNAVRDESGVVPEKLTEDSFQKIAWREHIARLLCTAVAWSPLYRGDEADFSYIAAAYRSSDIVVSRIDCISDPGNCVEEPPIIFKHRLDSDVTINRILWLDIGARRHVIVVCYFDGRIHGLRITERNGTFEDEELFRYYDDADRMSATDIQLLRRNDNGNSIVLATKSSCLVALSIDDHGKCERTRFSRVDGFSITGMTTISDDKAIVTTQNCRMYLVTVRDAEELSFETIKHDLKTSKVQYLGLVRSPNSAILINVTSPDGIHDHLINREPSTLQMFTLQDDERDPRGIADDVNNAKIAETYYWDYLEAIRIKASKCTELDKSSYDIPARLDGLSIHRLRVTMWLTLISEIVEKKEILKGVEKIVGDISEAQPLIFLLSACDHLEVLARKTSVDDDDKRCMSFLRMYMEIYIAGENEEEITSSRVSKRVARALAASSHVDSIETESCNLCGEIITELPWLVDSCTAGHKLPRCSRTLLQITSLRYRVCPICGRIFHPSLDLEYGETRCLYCDVPAQQDSRIISSSHGDVVTRWKNLSKRTASYQAESRAQENENERPNGPEKIKRRGMNPHTFAVIVNKDDDDSCITETWQEF